MNTPRRTKRRRRPTQSPQQIGAAQPQPSVNCPDYHFCFSFDNSDRARYMSHFFPRNGPVQFDKVIGPVRRLAMGANGFVNELIFQSDGGKFKICTILKSAIDITSDNLFVEAFIGLNFVNHLTRRFPLFLETYAALQYAASTTADAFPTRKGFRAPPTATTVPNPLKAGLRSGDAAAALFTAANIAEIPADMTATAPHSATLLRQTCSTLRAEDCAVLMQYMNHPIKLHDYFLSGIAASNSAELITILFQIYAVLTALRKEFTHYDLHAGNVLLYRIPENHILMRYHTEHDITEFRSKYIVKLIDYGRAYTPVNRRLFDALAAAGCARDRHRKLVGYEFMNTGGRDGDLFYIDQLLPNHSHDLRLVKDIIGDYWPRGVVEKGVVNHLLSGLYYATKDGTPTAAGNGAPSVIYTVADMYLRLKQALTGVTDDHMKAVIGNTMLFGTLDIWLENDRPMVFELADPLG